MNQNSFTDQKILIVEDEESLAKGLEFNLTEEGFHIKIAEDGQKALTYFEQEKFDLIILDIMLPYINGFQVIEKIRERSQQIPILVLTAKVNNPDKVKGLELGADDYVTKPFHLQELIARVKGMLKRKSWYNEYLAETTQIEFKGNKIDLKTLETSAKTKKFRLTQQEAMLIYYLYKNKGRILSREEILEKVWHLNKNIETRTVDNFIARLRKYFEEDPKNPQYIRSIRNAGYLFDY